MRQLNIAPAVRRGNKARIALAGPAGSGKTWTALTIASALAPDGPVLVIDTERGSASLYADEFAFDTVDWLPPYNPAELAAAVREVGPRYADGVIVVDSLSHFWQGEGGTLDVVDMAAARSRGNKFAGWKVGTPVQDEMVAAMLNAPCHVIATMRSKTEYVQDKEGDRTVIRKLGMAPVQRDGIEYEFTVTADLDLDHLLTVSKTRCSPLAGKGYRAGHATELGTTLRDWLNGAEPAATPATAEPPAAPPGDKPSPYAQAVHVEATRLGLSEPVLREVLVAVTGQPSANGVTRANREAVMSALRDVAEVRGTASVMPRASS